MTCAACRGGARFPSHKTNDTGTMCADRGEGATSCAMIERCTRAPGCGIPRNRWNRCVRTIMKVHTSHHNAREAFSSHRVSPVRVGRGEDNTRRKGRAVVGLILGVVRGVDHVDELRLRAVADPVVGRVGESGFDVREELLGRRFDGGSSVVRRHDGERQRLFFRVLCCVVFSCRCGNGGAERFFFSCMHAFAGVS